MMKVVLEAEIILVSVEDSRMDGVYPADCGNNTGSGVVMGNGEEKKDHRRLEG